MASVNVYLNFKDNCEKAFDFYKSVFGGDFRAKQRFSEMPASEKPLPKSEGKKILHVSLPIGESTVLMGSDTPSRMGAPTVGTNYSISVAAESEEEAQRVFKKLSTGGKTIMPMAKMFWGSLYGMCSDQFGVRWMVSFEYPKE